MWNLCSKMVMMDMLLFTNMLTMDNYNQELYLFSQEAGCHISDWKDRKLQTKWRAVQQYLLI